MIKQANHLQENGADGGESHQPRYSRSQFMDPGY